MNKNGQVICGICKNPVIMVEYSYDSPEHYDGTSEYWCKPCDIRVGRWSGNVLKEGEIEPRFGEERKHNLNK